MILIILEVKPVFGQGNKSAVLLFYTDSHNASHREFPCIRKFFIAALLVEKTHKIREHHHNTN